MLAAIVSRMQARCQRRRFVPWLRRNDTPQWIRCRLFKEIDRERISPHDSVARFEGSNDGENDPKEAEDNQKQDTDEREDQWNATAGIDKTTNDPVCDDFAMRVDFGDFSLFELPYQNGDHEPSERNHVASKLRNVKHDNPGFGIRFGKRYALRLLRHAIDQTLFSRGKLRIGDCSRGMELGQSGDLFRNVHCYEIMGAALFWQV